MNKKILFLTLIIVLAGVIIFGAGKTYAQNSPQNLHETIIQKLVKKFSLKESDVQSVFTEEQTSRQKEMEARFEEKLNQAVKDGKLTEAKKKLILEKHKEIKAQKQALQTWAKNNNIDMHYLMGGPGGRGGPL